MAQRHSNVDFLLMLFVFALGPAQGAQATTFNVLYTFEGQPDGATPEEKLLMDSSANLFGTTVSGGLGGGRGFGTVYRLAPDGTESVLLNFGDRGTGREPISSLVQDDLGNLYGTVVKGGGPKCGVVFELPPGGTEIVLHTFSFRKGCQPRGQIVRGKGGDLYGTTYNGGNCVEAYGCGVVYRIDPTGAESVLHFFNGSGDGSGPVGGLYEDNSGNLYGTTSFGGPSGYGTIFKVSSGSPTISFKTLYEFTGETDGGTPSGLFVDHAGNIFGTAFSGGANGLGTLFKLSPDGTFSVLHAFAGGNDGSYPRYPPMLDSQGNLFGTTPSGGSDNWGVVYEIAVDGTESILHNFTNGSDGGSPGSPLIEDASGNLYGTATRGGALDRCQNQGCGVLFELTP